MTYTKSAHKISAGKLEEKENCGCPDIDGWVLGAVYNG
jgi:hypothetical protein